MEFISMTNLGCLGFRMAGGGWVCQQMDYNVQVCDPFYFLTLCFNIICDRSCCCHVLFCLNPSYCQILGGQKSAR